MAIAVKERDKVELVILEGKPKFRDPATMTEAELTDPDYRLKQLMEQFGGNKEGKPAICSKCHHCR